MSDHKVILLPPGPSPNGLSTHLRANGCLRKAALFDEDERNGVVYPSPKWAAIGIKGHALLEHYHTGRLAGGGRGRWWLVVEAEPSAGRHAPDSDQDPLGAACIGRTTQGGEEVMATKKATKSAGGWKIGQAYLIRTVTMILTGRLVSVDEHELWIEDAAWIAETARYADTLRTGSVREVEPYPDGAVIAVGRGAIVDAAPWAHPLPRAQA